MGVLAVYDTVGIQNYIFSSNKLAENVGASKLVADVFSETLPDVITEVTKEERFRWKDHRTEGFNDHLSAEIIYQGGGNAYIKFKDEKVFQDVTEAFLTAVSLNARGIGVAVAAIETDFKDTYKPDFEKLNNRLTLVKGGFNIPAFAGNQPITKQSKRTGLPTSLEKEEEYLSESQWLKRKKYSEYKNKSGTTIKDFDNLAFEKDTDSLIAIVHADGNNMGSQIKEFMQGFKANADYEEVVPEIRQLSYRIDKCYKAAREKTMELFNDEYKKYVEDLKKKTPTRQISETPPILELIGDGDDTTVVIGGRFAIDFAVTLLKKIEATPENMRPFKDRVPTACAGVVIFHCHYPFSEAYKLAEELCSSAKKPSRKLDGSYIDFHLHQSGRVSSLNMLRERQYTIDGKSVLRRPWRVSKGREKEYQNFSWFMANMEKISNTDEYPRNKLKEIRNAIGAGDKAAKLAENKLRGAKLPELELEQIEDSKKEETSSYAAVFDILEMLDVYENLMNKGDIGDGK